MSISRIITNFSTSAGRTFSSAPSICILSKNGCGGFASLPSLQSHIQAPLQLISSECLIKLTPDRVKAIVVCKGNPLELANSLYANGTAERLKSLVSAGAIYFGIGPGATLADLLGISDKTLSTTTALGFSIVSGNYGEGRFMLTPPNIHIGQKDLPPPLNMKVDYQGTVEAYEREKQQLWRSLLEGVGIHTINSQ